MKKVLLSTLIRTMFCLVLGSYAQAQTVLVSDIDDTLKISHVLDWADAAGNLVQMGNHFLGMSQVYNLLQEEKIKSGSPSPIQFFYVTNAIDYMQALHEEFLRQNGFPTGPAFLRSSFSEQNFKILQITAIIEKTKPHHLILIGDNGEKDPEIYVEIARRYPALKISSFIHQVYSVLSWFEVGKPLLAGQKGYVTAVDLAFNFKNLGLINSSSYQQLINFLIPRILKENDQQFVGELAFPGWMDCQDFNGFYLDQSTPLLIQYAQKVHQLCRP